jgi:hypothetical protein
LAVLLDAGIVQAVASEDSDEDIAADDFEE